MGENTQKSEFKKHKKLIISLVAILVAVAISVIFVQAASEKIPYFKTKNELTISQLVTGEEKFLRVDDTSDVLVLGDYRYPTLYDGSFERLHAKNSPPFTVGLTGKSVQKAYKGTPFYHIVPISRGTARNLIEPNDLTNGDKIRTVFNGNPEYVLDKLKRYNVQLTAGNKNLGDFYYIGNIASLTGGFVENTGGELDSINPTRLRWLVTAWPDLNSFKTDKTKYLVGDKVAFNFDGWEYAYDKSGISYKIVIEKDGKQVGEFPGTAPTTKGATSTINPKQDKEHTGKFDVKNVFNFEPKVEGSYVAKLTVNDSVERNDIKSISFAVGENVIPEPIPEDPGNTKPDPVPIPDPNLPPVAIINAPDEVEIGDKLCIRSASTDPDGFIESYDWTFSGQYPKTDSNDDIFTETSDGECNVYFTKEGTVKVILRVYDDDGAWADSDEKFIKVTKPKPRANLNVGGYLIENRAMWIETEDPYGGNATAHKVAPITKEVLTIRGIDNDNTVIHYRPKPQGSYNEMLIYVYIDTNKNGVGDEDDTGFIYSNKEHVTNQVFQGSDDNGIVFNFGYNDSGIDDKSLYEITDIKISTPKKTFVLAAPLNLEVIDEYQIIENNILHAALVLKQN